MDKHHDQRPPPLRDAFTGNGAARPPDPREDLLQPWLRLSTRLSALIGDSGFCALYGRTARLVGPQFDWLPDGQSCKSIQHLLSTLREHFAAADAELADQANAVLLNTFTKLLSTLIGEALTIRLLASAGPGEDEHKNAQEHM
ncbi:MAG: hypothetical protein ABIT83_08885 [Massilia sp.]